MKIAEISARFDVSQDTLRYYERIGLIPPVKRTQAGIRDYDEEDCRWIEFIKCMRSSGLPIEALINYVALFQKGDDTILERKAILIEQREQLQLKIHEMNATLTRMNMKIANYEQRFQKKENQLKLRKERV